MPHVDRLDRLLRLSAERFADKIAIKDPGVGHISYLDLLRAAEQIADGLRALGVGPGDRVGICAPKSIGTVSALFGVLQAGAAYVPVDSTAPSERNAYIFRDCSVRALITTPFLLDRFQGQSDLASVEAVADYGVSGAREPPLTLAANPDTSTTRIDDPTSPPDLAYILYTSGSTGKPKGVMHAHSTALSFIDWCSQELQATEGDYFSSHAPFHFDLSILDLFVSLKHGSTLVLIGEEQGKQPQQLAQLIADEQISVWYSTPSILRLLVEYGRIERFTYPNLRVVCYAGEVFPPKHQQALRAQWPHPKYYNLYGPTETNVCTFDCVTEAFPADYQGPLPIGRACSGDRTLVVDAEGQPVAAGEEGELLVCGGSVMLGYWNLPEQNERAFVLDSDGTRWYRTGDMVAENVDGSLLYLGRRDRMVKRRGYRVELGEIESVLHTHDDIAEAGVIAYPDPESGVLVKAFVSWTGEKKPSIIDLKGFAAAHLPAYMVPDRFVLLPSLPKTSTDKLDYQKLRELEL